MADFTIYYLDSVVRLARRLRSGRVLTRKLLDRGVPMRPRSSSREAVALALAAVTRSRERLNRGDADLLYHLLVFPQGANVNLSEVETVLAPAPALPAAEGSRRAAEPGTDDGKTHRRRAFSLPRFLACRLGAARPRDLV